MEIQTVFVLSRLIRVVGTHNTINKVFHLVSMEVYYIQEPFALVGDLYGMRHGFIAYCFSLLVNLAPVDNVATLSASAIVSEGVSRVRNALINGDYLSYDWDSGNNKRIMSFM